MADRSGAVHDHDCKGQLLGNGAPLTAVSKKIVTLGGADHVEFFLNDKGVAEHFTVELAEVLAAILARWLPPYDVNS